MIHNDVYLKNHEELLFSNVENINAKRKKVLKKFIPEYFNKNNENLKYLDLKNLNSFKYNYKKSEKDIETKIDNKGNYLINIVNGNCNNFEDKKIEIHNLTSNDSGIFFNNDFQLDNDYILDLNSIFLNSGVKIRINKNQNVLFKMKNIVSDNFLTIFQKNIIICEEGSNVNIIEEYNNNNSSMNNVVNLFKVEKEAQINHYVIEQNSENHTLYLSTYASCKKHSKLNQKVFNFSDGFVRNFHFSDLIEPEAQVSHRGYFFLKNNNTTNNKTYVRHKAENCESIQVYKGVLNNNSIASYYSNTLVDKIAQKTQGYQLSKGILLSENSRYFSKPELRIYADDVKCSHGSTIGPIDENQIYYLRSRGMNKQNAIKILISALLHEDIEQEESNNLNLKKKLTNFLKNIK